MVDNTDNFESDLHEQLRARAAPAGFTDRVMARVEKRNQGRSWRLFFGTRWRPAWSWAAVAALLAITVAGSLEREREQRIAGEHAREQVLLALRITGTTLNQVQQKVNADTNPGGNRHGHTIDLTP